MKRLPIRIKITLWFTAALVLVVAFTYTAVISVSNQIIQKTIRDNLIETVENNVDEIEYYASLDKTGNSNDNDFFIEYLDGYLEIDDDFLDSVNEVYTALYDSDKTLLYGENPILKSSLTLDFRNLQIQHITSNGTLYYIFDRKLTVSPAQELWLRGIVPETQGAVYINEIARVSLVALPLIVLLAAVGGYLIARKMLRPIRDISQTASYIGQSGDLKKRIDLGKGNDELHRLADTFNEMFARLEQSFEAERQFTFDASHELRTPMAVITAQCEYSLEKERTAEEYEEALTVINRQGRKMSRLINDMLSFARLETRSENYTKEEIDMTALTESLCADMALIKQNGITLTCEAEEGIFCLGSRDLLSRLLSNLISNAYRYGKENGHIHVRLTKDGDKLRLSVSDDGIGIVKEEQEKIFRRFYRAEGSRTGTGVGLGLSMVQEIAHFHGGEISVKSEPGIGSEFIFSLTAF